MEHHFNTEVAKLHGVDKAIILHNLAYWIKKNIANKRNYHDGKYWTYNSASAFVELFPYWSKDKIYRMLKTLEEDGIIQSGNFNQLQFDRTKWYCITNKSILEIYNLHVAELQNGSCETATPIPDSKPDSKPDYPQTPTGDSVDYDLLLKHFNKITGKRTRVVPEKAKRQLRARLKEGYTKTEVLEALNNCIRDDHHIQSNLKYVTLEFITRSDKLDRYLNNSVIKQKHEFDPNDL